MIEVMTREITQDFRKAERKLKSLAAQSNAENSRLIKNVQQSIAAELQTLSQDFRKQQKGYLQRLRKQQEVTALSPTFGGPSLLDDNGDFDSGFTESQILKSRESENLVVEREKDIQTIVCSVEELATIMRDLSVLVIDQGSVVDRIDYNMEQVATHVEEGVKELVKAEEQQDDALHYVPLLRMYTNDHGCHVPKADVAMETYTRSIDLLYLMWRERAKGRVVVVY